MVANSVKFTDHGYIDVHCGLQRDVDAGALVPEGHVALEIVISDSGCGIPTEKLEAMFFTLEGADEGESQNVEGTGLGLGLAVVARIVEQLDGQLRAESEVGVGSRFFFTLTMRVHDVSESMKSPSPSVGSQVLRHGPSSSNGSAISRASPASEIDSFVQEFASSHMVTPAQPSVSHDDHRLREAEHRMSKPGTFPVADSSWPVRPTRMDGGDSDHSGTSSGRLRATPPVASPRLTSAPSFTRRMSTRRPTARITGPSAEPSTHSSFESQKSPGPNSALSSPFHEPPSPMLSLAGGSRRPENKMRVLVVEDDPINSQILQKRLRMDKHHVTPVENGQEAVDKLRSDWDYDMVLMDIQWVNSYVSQLYIY